MINDWAAANTKWPFAKKSPPAIEKREPLPIAGFDAVFVVWTVSVFVPSVIFSPGVSLNCEVADVASPRYCTYNVAGSDPEIATLSRTFTLTFEVAPVNIFPAIEAVGRAFEVVFNFTNS